ncbi:hypothetical protein OPT61_g10610 [Boeremia exigua]|uniref:Uncharacterized protein n=1 Tax=Boeremia exigua TaxID=749465 RepID=A0ACC2HNU1_9PLEO|nr:hypothetical protein OPT61_g10610 [Boeremia exigua]
MSAENAPSVPDMTVPPVLEKNARMNNAHRNVESEMSPPRLTSCVAASSLHPPRAPGWQEVFGRVHGKHVAHHLGEDGRRAPDMQVHGVDAHQHKPKAVPAMCATRQVREAEKAPFVVVFILGNRGRRDKLAHEPARGPAIRLDERRLLVGPVRIPQRAMHHVKRVPKLLLLGYTGLWVRHKQLDDRWGIDHSSIPLTEPTCSCGNGLLSHSELKIQVSRARCGMDPGNGIARTSFRGGGPGTFGSGSACIQVMGAEHSVSAARARLEMQGTSTAARVVHAVDAEPRHRKGSAAH